jgi:hypothetical protein
VSFTTRTVTHGFENADGTPASGTIEFALTKRMTNGSTTLVPATVNGPLSSTGALSVSLAANDDAGTAPAGAQWRVTFRVLGSDIEQFYITVPSAGSGNVDLGSLLPSTSQVA